jgi:hypothetical protein
MKSRPMGLRASLACGSVQKFQSSPVLQKTKESLIRPDLIESNATELFHLSSFNKSERMICHQLHFLEFFLKEILTVTNLCTQLTFTYHYDKVVIQIHVLRSVFFVIADYFELRLKSTI